ncbi:MAG: hypothetical protein WBC67_02925 [Candidatus Acidiferrales bacterium]
MTFFLYIYLITLTAGTLVYPFLIALILGHRRPRPFERLLFFLVLALVPSSLALLLSTTLTAGAMTMLHGAS